MGGEVGARLKSHLELCHPCSESPQLSACQALKGWSHRQSPCMWAAAETLGTSAIRARGLLPARGSGTHIWKPSNHDRPLLEAWALCPPQRWRILCPGPREATLPVTLGWGGICVHTVRPTTPARTMARANACSRPGPQPTRATCPRHRARGWHGHFQVNPERNQKQGSRQGAPRGQGLHAGHVLGPPPGLAQSSRPSVNIC